jgi:(R)-2-hydroxyacyl-CoA dehydratese activating ATPase
MITAGIDVGSLSTKAVIMKNGEELGNSIILTIPDSEASARMAMEKVLQKSNLGLSDIQYIIGTGYGRVNIPFANGTVTEISCHAKGAQVQNVNVRTILDMGGQDCKAIRCDEKGKVMNFVMNDKCAAGTGRFLERIAATINCHLDQLGPRSLQGVNRNLPISGTCAVFAEGDILKLIRRGQNLNDILAGALDSLVRRIQGLLGRVGVEEVLCISGGVAKNIGIVKRLEENLGMEVFLPADPQLVGAFGAALIALDRFKSQTHKHSVQGVVDIMN